MPPQVATVSSLYDDVLRHARYSLGADPHQLSAQETFQALGLAVRDRLIDRWLATQQRYRQARAKRICYLSLEFFIGRSLRNNLVNLGLLEEACSLLPAFGTTLEEVEEAETDAALGNGGLGRLAACYLDSMATLGLPGVGYGINYEFGLFRQEIRGGEQIETPDCWRTYFTPWLLEKPEEVVIVPLYGYVQHGWDRGGHYNPMWLDWQPVLGVPHDMLIAGYGGHTVNTLRLYSARAIHEVDMQIFNAGDYITAVQDRIHSETISKILYPSANFPQGQKLRLIQEYFLVACAVRDIIRTYQHEHDSFDRFADHAAIQLNDTHPALTVAELMRIFVDEKDLSWEQAWEQTVAACAYTNHTLMSEALEKWPVQLLEEVLPRHMQIIFEINRRFLDDVGRRWPKDMGRLQRMSLIEERPARQVRMANLAMVGCHSVNGVAALHTELVKTELAPDFAQFFPERFNNKTNGVTQRRWLLSANPGLARLLTEAVGESWITDLERLHAVEPLATDAGFLDRFSQVKRANKERLAKTIRAATGQRVDPACVFDVQVKRIHEYKRQLLHVLLIVHEYLELTDAGRPPSVPRLHVFGGKAAPGYQAAKQIIRLIHDVAQVVNSDFRALGKLQVVFVPDYRVSLAEVIIPAADLSEQISTAGTEASGTGNMKFALNGALTMGTLDGANVEIREAVGPDNVFTFGLTVPEVRRLWRERSYRPWDLYHKNDSIRRVMDALRAGRFCPDNPARHEWVWNKLMEEQEPYLHLADLGAYMAAQGDAGMLYLDQREWQRRAVLNVARMGRFSSDRSVREYAAEIWKVSPVDAQRGFR